MNNNFLVLFKTLYLSFFTEEEAITIIKMIEQSKVELSESNYSSLVTLFHTLKDTTEQFRLNYLIDAVKSVFVNKLDLYVINTYKETDVELRITMSEGDNWSAYSLVIGVWTDENLIYPISTEVSGKNYDVNAPYIDLTVTDIGSNNLLDSNKIYKAVAYLYTGGNSAEATIVVSTFYFVLNESVDESSNVGYVP